jgi:hypothetical protein
MKLVMLIWLFFFPPPRREWFGCRDRREYIKGKGKRR